jgi:CubicO group peptidase (beta-lactamase class C family)
LLRAELRSESEERFAVLDSIDTKNLTARIDAAIDSAIARKTIVGTVLLVARHGAVVYRRAAGLADREGKRPMQMDAIFRLASCTKPLVAATALATVDAGLLGLDDEVRGHLPYFVPRLADGSDAKMLVRHLLTHTSGLSYDANLLAEVDASPGMHGPILPIEENVRRLGQMRLKFAPGTGWEYSTAIDVLGCVIGAINSSTVDEAVQHYVTGPLGMADTQFGVTDMARLATPYGDGKPEPVRMGDPYFLPNRDDDGGTWFVPSRVFNPLAPQSAGAGMAGSAGDFLKFLEMLRSGGGNVLKPATVTAAMQNQIGDIPRRAEDAGKRFGLLGAVLDDPVLARSPSAKGTNDWGGVYGHNWFIDPTAGLSVASFSNTAAEGCNGPYREEIRDAIYGAGA